ncbi:aminofutalosine synthase MqnE [Candidatus Magnetominusculus xianensis]|uniref:Aminodeoxyfutalosine synthase n=1 Tax=Candidatus Magnetominusculus xianensis TaxID=1748249 RepID=A0ABR5SH15_9BACT|nr:aminofutalosine synthase MqnE [Candidatus Magnetominusculus xianensis]KWT82793.1 aminofutalosine synthase MqnE [Candidatus Magnetominusculus xianensis]MBF0403482.1 aminofutalosine synthase MqnE [Nitrospirota bacterium]
MHLNVLDKVYCGERLGRDDALGLFNSDDLFDTGRAAAFAAQQRHGKKVYYTRNHHINPTNICVNRCRFCAFSRSTGQDGAYAMTIDDILAKLASTHSPFNELHIVGGLHPDWPFSYYLDLISRIKIQYPRVQIKAFTAVEVDHFTKLSGLGLQGTLAELKSHGLDMMPGGGAEIFNETVRARLCPEKIPAARWLEIHEAAHTLGIKTNATMLYGHIESFGDRVDHLMALRALQDRTGGFQAFIPLSYQPVASVADVTPSGIDDLKTIAVSRIVLDNFPHIKAYWIMLGEKICQIALYFGATDIDGTVIEEKIAHSAGASSAEMLTTEQMIHLITRAQKEPVERSATYEELSI